MKDDIQIIKVHLVIGTPGRILHMISKNILNIQNWKIVVLDDADEIVMCGFYIQEIFKKIWKCADLIVFDKFSEWNGRIL